MGLEEVAGLIWLLRLAPSGATMNIVFALSAVPCTGRNPRATQTSKTHHDFGQQSDKIIFLGSQLLGGLYFASGWL